MFLPAAIQVRRPDLTLVPYRLSVPFRWTLHTVECPADTDLLNLARTHPNPPHFWACPARRQLIQNIDTNLAGRALHHPAGAVETNHACAIQVELAGTAASSHTWPKDWLDWLHDVLLYPVAVEHHIDLDIYPTFLPYPESYGNTPARMTEMEWLKFNGICGHSHVPANDHGDPGAIDIERLTLNPTSPVTPAQALLVIGV